jgi:hypothetical protein
MATNKTRIFVQEAGGVSGPFVGVAEFDVYQEALDYASGIVRAGRAASGDAFAVFVYVFSYDNPSYSYYYDGAAFRRYPITFPDPIT